MAAGLGETGGRRWTSLSAFVTPLLVVLGLNIDCAGSDPMKGVIAAGTVGMSQPRLVYLKPGLRITNKAPKDWSHLVMKSIPRLATGELGTLPAGSRKTATLFRSVLLANVKPVDINEKEFELTQIGLGICIPDPQDEDQDIVVTADTLDALGLRHLTTIQRMVLDAAEEEMAEGRIIARTPTFALFRSPVTLLDPGPSGRHSKANIHYAHLRQSHNGQAGSDRLDRENRVGISVGADQRRSDETGCCLPVRPRRASKTDPGNGALFLVVCHAGPSAGIEAAGATRSGARMVEASRHPANSDPDELEDLLQKIIPATPASDIAGENAVAPARMGPFGERLSRPLIERCSKIRLSLQRPSLPPWRRRRSRDAISRRRVFQRGSARVRCAVVASPH